MAPAGAEDPAVRALAWLSAQALRARWPARRLCGTVRVAVVYVAALLGAFLLTEGSMCLRKYWGPQLHELVITTAVLTFMGAVGDVAVLASILGWGRFAAGGKLSRLLCGRLALASAHLPLAPIWVIWALVKSAERTSLLEIAAWETGRLVGTLLLVALLYCLLSELHPDEEQVVSWVSTHGPSAASMHVPVALTDPVSHYPVSHYPATIIPATTIPATAIPTTTISTTTIPSTTIPSTTIPSTTVPSTTIPISTIPISTIPTNTSPATAIPTTTIPSTTISATNTTISATTTSAVPAEEPTPGPAPPPRRHN